ncbi:sugar phosphate nucleotidyltransferase [Deinococcus hopiensis]|uniref:Glucose-1-phosphate thymidylyltransferase n=1 Tax=Deinococcus hopiensis KR-140 TaxID=695939 RepID=A0A1W1VQC8_9DEIO|nr:sugar phosphate nucleotidyltransferase [Deinococcus hopiensis]SMB95559.1 glucose-1-phosphate thymidylyltransferase [Deinococcus hopiensis KR-140]
MKGVILAAGRGSRLFPVSAGRPKPAVPVAGVPIVARAVRALRAAGVAEVAVVMGPGHQDALRDATRNEGPLTFVPQHEPLGTGHAVLMARDFLEGGPALLYLGDNLFGDALTPLAHALGDADAALAVKQVPDPSAYGVAVVSEGWLTQLIEKPRRPPSDLAACGVFAFQGHVLDEVAQLVPSERGEIEFPQALLRVVAAGGRVRAVTLDGFWSDAGTPGDLLAANAHFLLSLSPRVEGQVCRSALSGPVVIEAGAVVENTTLIGPVLIGAGASIQNSTVGPNVSVGPRVRIEGATVQDSLIDEGASILFPSRPLTRAVIGRRAVVGPPTGAGLQLVVGDYSVLRV